MARSGKKVQKKVEGGRSKEGPRSKAQGGRPGKYEPIYCVMAEVACEYGATDERLARDFKVAEKTIDNWKKRYPEFKEAVRRGKYKCDSETVVDSLFKRANGFSILVQEDVLVADPDRKKGYKIVPIQKQKYFPPDPASMIFWLCNRQPGEWQRKPVEIKDRKRPAPQIVRFAEAEAKAG